MTIGKYIALTTHTFVDKVMSLPFYILSRFVIALLPRNKHLLISWLQSPSSDCGAQEEKNLSLLLLFPLRFAMKWWDQMPWSLFFECWVLSQLFPLSSLTFIKRLFSSSSLSAIMVVSSAQPYQLVRLLIFLLAILIPACALSSPAFHIMYSAYK